MWAIIVLSNAETAQLYFKGESTFWFLASSSSLSLSTRNPRNTSFFLEDKKNSSFFFIFGTKNNYYSTFFLDEHKILFLFCVFYLNSILELIIIIRAFSLVVNKLVNLVLNMIKFYFRLNYYYFSPEITIFKKSN